MNNADFHRDRPSLQLIGKEFVIVVVVVFSAFSFTLGYFVGKTGIEKKPENLSPAAGITPIPLAGEAGTLPLSHTITEADNTAPTTDAAGESSLPESKDPLVIIDTKPSVPAKSSQNQKTQTPEQSASLQKSKDSNQEPAAKDKAVQQENRDSDKPIYALQIGAFKSSAEAEAVRKQYAKKGFKTYITVASTKKQEKIYKVKAGEFSNRKSAEILSLKLNKTEKLKTFVTLKND